MAHLPDYLVAHSLSPFAFVFFHFTTVIMAPARSARDNQPMSAGLGHHFVSPKKARNPKKTQTLVHLPVIDSKRERLLTQMAALMNPQGSKTDTLNSSSLTVHSEVPTSADEAPSYTYDEEDYNMTNDDEHERQVSCPPAVVCKGTGHHILPDKMAHNLYSSWQGLIPTLVDAHLKYSA
ncbi:hypothetical protein BDR07DRAFT_1340717 [Suillus spraguei]|nr:hypothetical protein BDR07DRAFT_1340717 [Suillus spraguei]